MPDATAQQISDTVTQLNNIGQGLLNYRENNTLPADVDTELEELQTAILNKAAALSNLATITAGAEAATAIINLAAVTNQIGTTLENLNDIQKAIDIGTAALNVAVALASMNPQGIVTSTSALINLCSDNTN